MADINAGIHCILELYGCPRHILDDELFVCQALREASTRSLSTLLELSSHKFQPQGVTAIGLLAESHLSIHTWPEHNYAAVDIFTCGQSGDPQPACQYLIKKFSAQNHYQLLLSRGAGAPKVCSISPLASIEESKICPAPNLMPTCGSLNI